MKKMLLVMAASSLFVAGTALAQSETVTSVNVVGYMGLTITGDDTWTLLSVPMTKMPVATGTISGNTTTAITDSGASWATDTFAVGGGAAGETGSSTYYVEVTSGTFEGRHFYIANNDGTTLTLAAALTDINAGELAGQSYKIIPANRIRDIFGEPQVDVKLDTTDRIYLMQSTWVAPIFYRDNSSFFTPKNCWVQSEVNVDDLVVGRDTGMMVLRRGAGDVTLTVTGEVSANAQGVVVVPGWSILGGMSAVATPIGDAQLVAALGGSQDRIYAWTPTGWSAPVYYRDASSFFTPKDCWIQNDINVNETFIIEPGKAYMVKHSASESDVWNRESPLAGQ